MKQILLYAITFLFLTVSVFAQNDVQINIHHKLGTTDFAMQTAANNNIENNFKFSRLEYYISGISIVHDGGIETAIDDLYILAKVSETIEIELGNHPISSVEMVKFHIGVDEDHNHLDPALYESTHPLAPKFPSMHWGWASGYRFVALEGVSGNNYDQTIELHGLGDANYFTTEIPIATEAVNNEVVINLDADYTRALEDIAVTQGVIVHGVNMEAQQCLENFRDHVFSPSSITSSVLDFSEVQKFDVFPNPTNGNVTIALEASQDLRYDVAITDILGNQLLFFDAVSNHTALDVQLENAGFYFINLIKDGQVVITKKLISK